MSVPFNDLRPLYERHAAALEAEVIATMRSGWWLNGNRGKSFGAKFAEYVGAPECTLVANGTDALELVLRALKLRGEAGRNEIVTVANAGGYTTTACRQVGLVPVYVDIDRASQLMNFDAAMAALTAKTLAVVVTHLYGGAANVVELRAKLDAAGYVHLPIVEDCAQSHGATVDGRVTGSMGDIATFSFYPTKNLGALGDGGAILSANAELAATVRQLHQYGWASKYNIALGGGRNSRMDEVQAASLEVMLGKLDENNSERVGILNRYRVAAPRTTFVDGGPGSVAHLAVALVERRADFRAFMAERGVATDVHYPILDSDQTAWTNEPFRVAGSLDVSKASSAQLVSLPCFPGMTPDQIDLVSAALTAWDGQ